MGRLWIPSPDSRLLWLSGDRTHHHRVPQQRFVGNTALTSSSFFCNTIFSWIKNHATGGYITMPTMDIFLSPYCISVYAPTQFLSCSHTHSLSPSATHFHKHAPEARLHPQCKKLRLNAFSNWHPWLCPPPPVHLLPTLAYMLLTSYTAKEIHPRNIYSPTEPWMYFYNPME